MKDSRWLYKLGGSLIGIMMVIFALFPFYWAMVSSLKSGSEIFSARMIPNHLDLKNYYNIFLQQPFGTNIWNSIWISFCTVMISLSLGILAAFSLARSKFKGRRLILYHFLLISIFPQVAILSGLFELIRFLGLYNQGWGLVLSYLIFTLPFTTWTLTTYMKAIPREMEEAAILDGASNLTLIFKIFLPVMGPGAIATGLLAFVAAWNEFLFAVTFTVSEKSRTVPVAIAFMSGSSEHELPWGNIMAASVVVTVPLILLVILFQRYMVSGLTAGAVKG